MIEKIIKISNGVNKKFAVIGTGFIFRTHIQAINSVGGEIIDAVNESNGIDAWREMVRNTEADCLVILTPNDLHFEMAKFSSENGKIVLCEKPLVIKSEQAKILAKLQNIFSVYQLRYHPLTKKLKSEIQKDKNYEIEMDISVHRDEGYYKTWKGIPERSGGVLFNIGIHYFDLLLYLFGEPTKLLTKSLTDRTGTGTIEGKNYSVNWKVTIEEPKETQRRVFKINGVNYNFSSKENLAYENLHFYVYKDFLDGKGVTPKEALPSVELVEKLYTTYAK